MASSKALVLVFTIFLLTASLIHCENEDTESKTEPSDEPKDAEEAEKKDVVTDSDMQQENGVLVLTTDNFDDIVESSDSILVEFYAPWCGHCKSLAPQYEKAAKMLKDSDRPVPLGKVDSTKETELAKRFDISGYPTLKFFKNGQPIDYDGPRDADGIVEYVKKHSDPNWVPPVSSVLTLTQENFTDTVTASPLILVEFYAPWCGHCKQLAPQLEKAAKQLQDSDIPIAKVDATVDNTLAKLYDITGYPTMKLFRRGKAFEYKGPRDSDGIIDYMLSQSGEGSKELTSMKNTTAHMLDDDVTVIGFFSSAEDAVYDLYQEIANDLRENYTSGHTFEKSIANHYRVNPGSVVVFKAGRFYTKHEPKWHTIELKDTTKADEVVSFIKSHDVPLVGHMTLELEDKRYHSERRPLVLFFYTVDWSHEHRSATQFWRNKIADIAKDYPDMTFVIVDEDDFPDKMKGFGFDESGEEMNIGILDKNNKKYAMEEMDEFDSDEIREFINKFNKGKVSPQILSAPIPKKQTGPVTVVVGKTFEKIILDPKKDAIVMMYAQYCDVSKKFMPVYNKLAKKYKDNNNLVVTKMDAIANEYPPEYDAPPEKGYPAIYFAPADKKMAPTKYDGDRSFNDLVKFIEKHAMVSLKAKEEL